MSNYAVIDGDGICRTIKQVGGTIDDAFHIPINDLDATLLGQHWTGSAWEAGPTVYRTMLHPAEWVDLWTDAERSWLKTQREANTNAGRRLKDLWDAIITTNAIDVAAPQLDGFYNWLLNEGIPGGQGRINVLRQGVAQ